MIIAKNMKFKFFLFIFVAVQSCLINAEDAQCYKEVKGKDLYHLLSCADRYLLIKKTSPPKIRKELKKIVKEKCADRKKILSKDSCRTIYKADTIRVLDYSPIKESYFRGGFNEMIIGNGICFNYASVSEWPECKEFVKEMMTRIIGGNYKELAFENSLLNYMVIKLVYYLICQPNKGTFTIQKFHFVWRESPDLDIGECELYLVPDWED